MDKTAMTPEERLNAAINLQNVDRVPHGSIITTYAARYAGISNYEFYYNKEKAFKSMTDLKKRYPAWDIGHIAYYSFIYGPVLENLSLFKVKIPGHEIPPDYEYQFIEYDAMQRQDYSIILKKGVDAYLSEHLRRIHCVSDDDIAKARHLSKEIFIKEEEEFKKSGQACLYASWVESADELLSYTRSLPAFIRDIYQIPDLMEDLISIINEYLIKESKILVANTGIPRILVGLTRMNGRYFSLPLFERFCWKYLKRMLIELINNNITPVVHADGDWTSNLQYFLELPRKKIILQLDGCTDIFKAKKILGKHSCLMGDVPATMFTVGTPDQTRTYSKRLINEIGDGGGFILAAGCTLPFEAKHENVEAFFSSIYD